MKSCIKAYFALTKNNTQRGLTALKIAAMNNSCSVAKLLLENGAEVDMKNTVRLIYIVIYV
jgi:ankyrin repeat protein